MADGEYRRLNCGGCGLGFTLSATKGRPRKMCVSCRPPKKPKASPLLKPCPHCATVFQPVSGRQKYCKPECVWAAHNRRNHKPAAEERARRRAVSKYTKPCVQCGQTFYRKPSGKQLKLGHVSRWCSVRCKSAWLREHGKINVRPIAWAECGLCERKFIKRQTLKYCPSCKPVARRLLAARSHVEIKCRVCAVRFCRLPGAYTHRFCSNECRDAHTLGVKREYRQQRRRKFGKTYVSEAKKRGVSFEVIERMAVFERDGWTCCVCDKPTPRDLLKALHPDAPTLDHIHPRSKGGTHTWDNVATLCRACNTKKSTYFAIATWTGWGEDVDIAQVVRTSRPRVTVVRRGGYQSLGPCEIRPPVAPRVD